MPRPASLPAFDVLAERHEHGTYTRYKCGCRCDDCRKANRLYRRRRVRACLRGETNGLVSATPTRRHLSALREAGVGRKTVHAVSGVAYSLLVRIGQGRKTQIREQTARRVLAVKRTALREGARIDASATWRLINVLLDEWQLTRQELAELLGKKGNRPKLAISPTTVTLKTANRVRAVYQQLTGRKG